MLLLQGEDDREVTPSNALSLRRAMDSQHEDVTLKLYPGVGHEGVLLALSRPMRSDAATLPDVLAFIRTHPSPR
jgi:dipeptidyl aminopeptidase/acylaminoacyl peptidase